jgi:hypothetical protein
MILALAGCATKAEKMPAEGPSAFTAQLDEWLRDRNFAELNSAMEKASSDQAVAEAMGWTWAHLREGAPPLIGMNYGLRLWKQKRADEAAFVMLYMMAATWADMPQCADQTAPVRRLTALTSAYAEVHGYLGQLPAEQRRNIAVGAASMEAGTAPRRIDDALLCSGGQDDEEYYRDKYGDIRGEALAARLREDGVHVPRFVSQASWEPRRRQVEAALPATLQNYVAAAARPAAPR